MAPRWVLRAVVDAIHDQQLAEHGGASGVRDPALLWSALARPVNRHAYGETDLCALASAYAGSIAQNRPFIDGNKRTAFLTAFVFLRLNGLRLTASEADAAGIMIGLAAGEVTEDALAAWLRHNTEASGF